MDITRVYAKFRRDFGRQPMFCEAGPYVCDAIHPEVLEQHAYVLRNPVHRGVQNTPACSAHRVNTVRADHTATGVNHAEGGWPRDVHVYDPEMTQRYRRKVEKEENYIHCVQAIAPKLEHYIRQNNAIDMYQAYYAELAALPARASASCRTVNVYRDPAPLRRPVRALSWRPDGGHRFAAAYSLVDFNLAPIAPLQFYVWDVDNATAPESTLVAPAALLDLQYNPREPHQLAGGLASGQVAAWDARAGGAPCAACPPHAAHRDLARCVRFISAKSGQEFFSGGPDGVCKWWDIRNMAEPTDEMLMDPVRTSTEAQSAARANGVSALEYEHTIPTRFMAGTENGLVLGANRKGKTPLEKLPARYEAHVGPVWSVERNPGFLKNFLTVGDFTARVWSEECRESAVLWSPPQRHKVTAGVWSPTRLSVMVLTAWDGSLSVWDLLRRQATPVLAVQVCAEPLLVASVHHKGALVACGSGAGTVYLAEMSEGLAQSDKHDKALLTMIFERESHRERILEARLREIKLKHRQAEEGGAPDDEPDAALEAALGDRDLLEAAAAYQQEARRALAAV